MGEIVVMADKAFILFFPEKVVEKNHILIIVLQEVRVNHGLSSFRMQFTCKV